MNLVVRRGSWDVDDALQMHIYRVGNKFEVKRI